MYYLLMLPKVLRKFLKSQNLEMMNVVDCLNVFTAKSMNKVLKLHPRRIYFEIVQNFNMLKIYLIPIYTSSFLCNMNLSGKIHSNFSGFLVLGG